MSSFRDDAGPRLDAADKLSAKSGEVKLFAETGPQGSVVGVDAQARFNMWLSGFASAEARWSGKDDFTGRAVAGFRFHWE